jgi:rRNA maturation endonuclease Nob1
VLALTYAMDTEKKSSPASTSSPSDPSMPSTLSSEQPKDNAEQSQLAGPSTSTNIAGPSTAPKASPWGAVKKPVEVEQSEQVGDDHDEDADEEEEEAFPALPTGPSDRQEGDDEADRKAVEAHLAEMNITPSARSGAPPVQTEREKRIEELRREMQEEEARKQQFQQVYAEDDDEEAGEDGWDDSGAGEWITPENVTKHKAEDLGLLPTTRTEAGRSVGSGSAVIEGTTGTLPEVKKKKKRAPRKPQAQVGVACFTGDYAVQNVLVQMGLGLVGEGGKRIKSVKSWVLRCHACFK